MIGYNRLLVRVTRQQTAIDGQADAGDAAGCPRAQKDGSPTDVLRRPLPSQWHGILELFTNRSNAGCGGPEGMACVHVPGQDCIAADSVLPQVDGHALR